MINRIFKKLWNPINLILFKLLWKKNNRHNFTSVNNVFPMHKVTVGKKSYGPLNVHTYGNVNEKLIIGNYCSIAGDVLFLLGGEHSYKGISTYPFNLYICGLNDVPSTKGPIIIEDDVWIGQRCLILSGVTIGKGAVIAAGSTIVKDIPPYAIYAMGKIIKYRFSDEIIQKLQGFDYSLLDDEMIKRNIDFFNSELSIDMLDDDFVQIIKEIRGKNNE